MAQKLQIRLALAHFKVTRGWEDLPLDIIELRIDKELRRERLSSTGETISDSSSIAREPLTPSPLRTPLFSDSVGSRSSSSTRKLRKKVRFKLGQDIITPAGLHGSY
jgi:Whi5 like